CRGRPPLAGHAGPADRPAPLPDLPGALHGLQRGPAAADPRALLGPEAGPAPEMIAMIKRTFDLVAASAGLVALLPVLAVAAVLVRLGSPGPVLFRQAR